MAGENRNGVVELDFGDGRHRFRLAMGELEELQEKTGLGPFVLLGRLISGEWRVQDVAQTLRLGLIGGAMPPVDALNLVRRYVEQRPDWLANAALAKLIVMSALAGAPEEQPGKGGGRRPRTRRPSSRTAALPSAPTTEPPGPSVSVPPISAG